MLRIIKIIDAHLILVAEISITNQSTVRPAKKFNHLQNFPDHKQPIRESNVIFNRAVKQKPISLSSNCSKLKESFSEYMRRHKGFQWFLWDGGTNLFTLSLASSLNPLHLSDLHLHPSSCLSSPSSLEQPCVPSKELHKKLESAGDPLPLPSQQNQESLLLC